MFIDHTQSMKYENEIALTSMRHQPFDAMMGWGVGHFSKTDHFLFQFFRQFFFQIFKDRFFFQRRGQNIKYLFFIINTFLYVLSFRYILQKWIFFRSDFYFICFFLGSQIWPKCDVTRRQRPMRDLVSFTLQRNSRQHAQDAILGLFAAASLFRLATGWVSYPLVFIHLRSQIGMALFTTCLTRAHADISNVSTHTLDK